MCEKRQPEGPPDEVGSAAAMVACMSSLGMSWNLQLGGVGGGRLVSRRRQGVGERGVTSDLYLSRALLDYTGAADPSAASSALPGLKAAMQCLTLLSSAVRKASTPLWESLSREVSLPSATGRSGVASGK